MDDGDSRSGIGRGAAPDAAPDGAADRQLVVEVVDDDGDWSAFGDVAAAVTAAARLLQGTPEIALGRDGASAAVALSSDSAVRALNHSFRGKDKPTNVLSFPAPPPVTSAATGGSPRFLGDVVLAAETVLGEAAELGIPPVHHLQHLVVHGLLHLLGFDHETDEDAERMEALETRLLARIGIDDPHGERRA